MSRGNQGKVDISPITELTHDRNTSIRLYRSYRAKYPDSSPEWIVGLIVEHIERDRGFTRTRRVVRAQPRFTWPTWKRNYNSQWEDLTPQQQSLASLILAFVIPLSTWLWYENVGYVGTVHDRNYLNFPPPTLYQETQGETLVTVHNRSPQPMRIRLENGVQNYELSVEGCTNCPPMANEQLGDQLCNDHGPSLTFSIPPGIYDAKVTFMGSRTKGFKSQWTGQYEVFL
jgi:hypothetical protein